MKRSHENECKKINALFTLSINVTVNIKNATFNRQCVSMPRWLFITQTKWQIWWSQICNPFCPSQSPSERSKVPSVNVKLWRLVWMSLKRHLQHNRTVDYYKWNSWELYRWNLPFVNFNASFHIPRVSLQQEQNNLNTSIHWLRNSDHCWNSIGGLCFSISKTKLKNYFTIYNTNTEWNILNAQFFPRFHKNFALWVVVHKML